MTERIAGIIESASDVVWGLPAIVLILGAGAFFTIRFRVVQFRRFRHAWQLITGRYDDASDPGEISHFKALSSALSGTIGVGNIAGVASAIAGGGPGAVFWMWVTALFGMSVKFTCCTLAVKYRKTSPEGVVSGGPMYYIELGLGRRWKPLALLFAACGAISAFGIGNMVQSNKIAESLHLIASNALPAGAFVAPLYEPAQAGAFVPTPAHVVSALVAAALAGMVIIGGIRRIATVASRLVPLMCGFYIVISVVILLRYITHIDDALWLILKDAFTGQAMAGGAIGTTIRLGVSRGIFSNEAGLGSAPIAHAAAQTRYPIREGLVAMLGPFIDTIVVCSMTALVIVITESFATGYKDVTLTATAFESGLSFLGVANLGPLLVATAVVMFAFSTLLTWCYYGERCIEYLLGTWSIRYYRWVFIACIVIGGVASLNLVWNFSDVANGMMAFPNLVALVLLSPVVARELAAYNHRVRPGAR